MCRAPRMEAGEPQRFAGVDVADSRDARLVQQEILQRALRTGKQFAESGRCKTARESIFAQPREPRTFFDRFPSVHSAEVAPVRKAENAFVQFESNVHMNAVPRPIRMLQEFLRIQKPHKLAIQAEVHRQQTAIQQQENVFPPAIDLSNVPAFGKARNMSRSLRFRSNRMQDVDASDA